MMIFRFRDKKRLESSRNRLCTSQSIFEGGFKPCATLHVSANRRSELSSDPTVRLFFPCPKGCGRSGKRIRKEEREVPHIAYGQTVIILGRYGIYESRCDCGPKYFRSPIPGVPQKGNYSFEVRNVIVNSLIRDRLPYRKVQERMAEDFELRGISLGFIHTCFKWAYHQIDNEERRRWAVENFSGVLCIDEIHEGKRVILYATDPLHDFTVKFQISETNDQANMDAFLKDLKAMGINPEVIITDGSPLYKDALQEVWEHVEHQLCIFHVIKEVNKLILDGVRAIKNRLKRQAKKGRKRRRGRPSKSTQKRLAAKKKVTKKEEATMVWENQHLIVKREDRMTTTEKEMLQTMFVIAPHLKMFRSFCQDFYRLFERGMTQQQARYRRTLMANNQTYQANSFLRKALKKLNRKRFNKMIVFLNKGDVAERTSNHVERNNRSFRMLQKTRYKRRKELTIKMSIELDLYNRMLQHDLFKPHQKIALAMLQNREKVAA